MIDGTGKAPIADGAVVVVGDRFAWVGRRADLPDEWKKDAGEVTVVDAGAGTREHELIADAVHRLGKKCTVHARSAESLTFAAKAGFDWVYARLLHRRRGSRTVAEKQIPICPALPLLVNALDATGAEMSAASRDGLKRAKTRDRWQ